jgi:hypothetical protein
VHAISGVDLHVNAIGRILRSWRQATIPAPVFVARRGKSYNTSRRSLTYFPGFLSYYDLVSSIPQGLDFSPLPATQRVFSCLE